MADQENNQHTLFLRGVSFEERMIETVAAGMVQSDHFLALPEEKRKRIHAFLQILADDSVRHRELVQGLAEKYE